MSKVLKSLFLMAFISLSHTVFAETEEDIHESGVRVWKTKMDQAGSCSKVLGLAKDEGKQHCFEYTLDKKLCRVEVLKKISYEYQETKTCFMMGLWCDYYYVDKPACKVEVLTIEKKQ